MKRVGILGGTFDPPHLGHLVIAEETRLALGLEEIWFIPSYTPPHKDEAKTSVEDRIGMVEQAIEANDSFKINTIEVDRLGKSYTFDTMTALRLEYPSIDFYFIIGADMVEYLPHWDRIDDLINLVKFVGAKRTGYQLKTDYPIIEADMPIIDISSTIIRNRLANKKTVHYLIPETVYSYIKENQLYGNK